MRLGAVATQSTVRSAVPTVSIVADHLRTTSVALALDCGSSTDPDDATGVAHLVEHLVLSSTIDGTTLADFVVRTGGTTNAETGHEVMVFTLQVPSVDADAAVDRLISAILRPCISVAAFESERAVAIQEVLTAAADPSDVVQEDWLAATFPGGVLSRPIAGSIESLESLTLDEVLAAHQHTFATANMWLVSVGPAALSRFIADDAHVSAPVAPPLASTKAVTTASTRPEPDADEHWPDEFAWICLGGPAAASDAELRGAFAVLECLLGGRPSSLVFRALREAGLAYGFDAMYRGHREIGDFRIIVGVEPDNRPAVIEAIIATICSVADAQTPDDDLDVARRQAIMRVVTAAEIPPDWARELALLAVTRPGRPPTADELVAEIADVTGDQVAAAAAMLLPSLTIIARS